MFQVTINYLPMAEEGGEVREVRQKYLRYKRGITFSDSTLVKIVKVSQVQDYLFFNPYFLIAFDTFFSPKDFLWVSVHLSGLYTSGKLILKKCDKEATKLNVEC